MTSNKSLSPARMKRFLVMLALICFPVVAAAQEEEKKGESTITGRVVFSDTGKPVRRVGVGLFSKLNFPPVRITSTNRRGEFRFNQVAEGTYFVLAEAHDGVSPYKAFALTEFGLDSDIKVEQTRISVDGKGAARCEVRVVRAGAIKGTIVYSDKEPVTGAPILLFRRKSGLTAPYLTRQVLTNDRGMYRIDGLPEGEYFIGVVDSVRSLPSDSTPESGLATAYYPGVSNITEAKTIQVQAGSEVSAINITLAEDTLREISGVIKWRDGGKPVAGASLRLSRTDEPKNGVSFERLFGALLIATGYSPLDTIGMSTRQPVTRANEKGEWKFVDLPPGKYLLTAYISPSDKDNPDATDEELELDIEMLMNPDFRREPLIERRFELSVGDTDLNDVVLEMSEGGRISGVVVSEGGPAVPRLRIFLHRPGHAVDDAMVYATDDGGSFVLEGVPSGDTRLEATLMFGNIDAYVTSIKLGNQDLTRNPIRVEEGVEISGVRITVEKGGATLSGRVLSDSGSPASEAGVLLIKADPALWQLSTARVFGSADAAGEFVVQCAPGDYLAYTWTAANQPQQSLSEFIRTNATSARRVSLQKAEEKRVELTVMKPKP